MAQLMAIFWMIAFNIRTFVSSFIYWCQLYSNQNLTNERFWTSSLSLFM